MSGSSFKQDNDLESRKRVSKMIKEKFPQHVPVIIERADTKVEKMPKVRYLMPEDYTVAKLIMRIRTEIKVNSKTAIFIYVNGTIPNSSDKIVNVYNKHKDEDGFLYIRYAGENTFG